MKRAILLILFIIALVLPCSAKDKKTPILPNVFIVDTSDAKDEVIFEDPTPLKGYAEYLEDTEAIYLTDENGNFVLNLKVPQKITPKKLSEEYKTYTIGSTPVFSRKNSEEYQITPMGRDSIVTAGNISFGTTYEQDVDRSELEQTTGLFTKYQKGRFAVKTAYNRTIGSTYSSYSDSIYISPEFKINKMFTIKQVLTNNFTYETRKNELILSINPLAYTKDDRLNIEIGAGQTYNQENDIIRNRIRFNTKLKL